MERFDSYVIRPFRLFDAGTAKGIAVEVCDPDQAEWWTVFGRSGRNAEPLGDFATRDDAEDAYHRLSGKPYPG